MNLDIGDDSTLTLNEYQDEALATAVYSDDDAIVYTTMGLVGEAGEIANKVKKVMRGDKELDDNFIRELSKEIGDVLWYVAALSDSLNIDLETIAVRNLIKLNKRRINNTIQGDGDNR